MRVWVSSIIGLALSFKNVVASTTATLDKNKDEQFRVLRGIQQGKHFTPTSGLARMALTNLGHALEHFNDKQQQSLDNNHHDFSVRLLSEVTAKQQEEFALVDSLATAIEQLDTQAFEANMASIRQLLKDTIAWMQEDVSDDTQELKDMLKLFDIVNQLKLRLVQNEAGTVTIQFADEAAATEVSKVEVAGGVGRPDNGRFGDKTPSPTPSPTITSSPTDSPPKKDLGEIDSVELIRFIIFILGFPGCVIFTGLPACTVFAFQLYICGVLGDPPPGKTEFCEDFDDNPGPFVF